MGITMTTWTIRVDEVLDKLVDDNVKSLGYTSKAELIREAVRIYILDRNISRLGLSTLERERKNAESSHAEQALSRFRSLTKDKLLVKKVLDEERQILEDALLKITGD